MPVDDADLQDALELGADARVVAIERRPSAYGSSFALEDVTVHLADGRILAIVFKDLSADAMLESARRAKPAFLYDPLREIEVYRRVLSPAALGTPGCYGTRVDQAAGRYWLFLERIAGRELYQEGDLGMWQAAARWLGGMHAHFAGRLAALPAELEGHLLVYDGMYYRRWIDRALEFRPGEARLTWLRERYDQVVERLVALPTTLVHGDFHASNILVASTSSGMRICPVDWEMCGLGPALLDLAALIAGAWTDAEQRAIALAYHDAMPAASAGTTSRDRLLEDLDYCRLHLAVQWLGWSADWRPPATHAHDWLGEAARLGERLLV
jgi:aminoglycoside phosphotransferase (APT) family kinase protein